MSLGCSDIAFQLEVGRMPPYRIDYYCPREAQFWQRFGRGFFSPSGSAFSFLNTAVDTANTLLWRYHSARVVDSLGNVVYQI